MDVFLTAKLASDLDMCEHVSFQMSNKTHSMSRCLELLSIVTRTMPPTSCTTNRAETSAKLEYGSDTMNTDGRLHDIHQRGAGKHHYLRGGPLPGISVPRHAKTEEEHISH
jgi:hypothetical protein